MEVPSRGILADYHTLLAVAELLLQVLLRRPEATGGQGTLYEFTGLNTHDRITYNDTNLFLPFSSGEI